MLTKKPEKTRRTDANHEANSIHNSVLVLHTLPKQESNLFINTFKISHLEAAVTLTNISSLTLKNNGGNI